MDPAGILPGGREVLAGGTLGQYVADDLVLADGWASFTVDSFSSYAVTAVPEPMTLSLMGLGAAALLRKRRQR